MANTSSSTGTTSSKAAPEWSPLSGTEVEQIVVKLARDGTTASRIGLILRDTHGVPSIEAITGKSMRQILVANKLQGPVPEDLHQLIKRAVNLQSHLQDNTRDLHNRRALELIESRIRRLAKYYKRTGLIPYDWKYNKQTARLLAE